MRIQHNIMAMNSYRNYNNNVSALSKNLEKLSSGYRVNRAGDDAAGLAISEKMRAQITGLDAAQKNVKDGISLVKTAEGALQEVQDMLNRVKYLAVQSANGTYDNDVDRANLQKEVDALKNEINRIADSANFNGQKLLDGSLGDRTTAFTAVANGISDIVITGGGTKAPATGTLTQNPIVTAGMANTTAGDMTVTFAQVTGIKWEYVDANGDKKYITYDENTAALSGIADETGGSVTFKAVRDLDANGDLNSASDVLLADVEFLEGMSITIVADAPQASDGEWKADTSDVQVGDPKGLTLQIGDTAHDYNQLTVNVGDMHVDALGLSDLSVATLSGAQAAVDKITEAINQVSSTRGDLGAIQNRLEHTANNLSVMEENIQDAESTIRDTDVADEMMAYTKNNILIQSAQAMLAQANAVPQGVLQLLQ